MGIHHKCVVSAAGSNIPGITHDHNRGRFGFHEATPFHSGRLRRRRLECPCLASAWQLYPWKKRHHEDWTRMCSVAVQLHPLHVVPLTSLLTTIHSVERYSTNALYVASNTARRRCWRITQHIATIHASASWQGRRLRLLALMPHSGMHRLSSSIAPN